MPRLRAEEVGLTKPTANSMSESHSKKLMVVAATVSAAGLFALAAGRRDIGGVFVVVGWALFIAAIHFFGRLGSQK